MAKRWYIVHAYTNFERKVADAIKERARSAGLDNLFEEVVVPTEEVVEVKRGRKVQAERKFLPGYVLVKMEMTDAEVGNLREYVRRGGFILIDDFDTWHMDNLREEMSRAFPDKIFERLEPDHPILDVIFTIADLGRMGLHVPGDEPVYYAMRNDEGEIAIVACHNNDLANFWEWYGSPQYPLEPSTDAFRLGANLVVYAFTH